MVSTVWVPMAAWHRWPDHLTVQPGTLWHCKRQQWRAGELQNAEVANHVAVVKRNGHIVMEFSKEMVLEFSKEMV